MDSHEDSGISKLSSIVKLLPNQSEVLFEFIRRATLFSQQDWEKQWRQRGKLESHRKAW